MLRILLCLLAVLASSVRGFASGPVVPGKLAVLKGKVAYAPAQAPLAVQQAIWAVNKIQSKPYRWGGGHGSFEDRGYDCSGTVSYLLHHAGLLDSPSPSRGLLTFGEAGPGRWITVYARKGHVFAVVCGLRLDTTGTRAEEGPRWRPDVRVPRGFIARRPKGL
ncbi:MAG TPA: hypothetical protein VF593_06940 [Chthoniobacteraceae bacterium]|jgi:hypothetical protein